jgi:uncharacterized protein YcbK (DUF882 family)
VAGFAVLLAAAWMSVAPARAETRTLKLYNVHTKERAEITFKRNGRYISDGLRKANRLLRDWRRNEPTKMDPRLLDLVWEAYRAVGARDYIHIVSGYRSPATNSMLRRTRGGQAKKSQHMLGKAMDFYIPGVSLAKLRAVGLKAQVGGVGYYPRSGSPFVHLDVGNVRHWPRMSRKQLMAVFPDGKSIHVPSDGKPLPRYKEALASYNSRKKSGTSTFALLNSAGGDDDGAKKPTLLAALFGGGADEEEETSSEFESKPSAAAAKKAIEADEGEATAASPKEPVKPVEEPKPVEEEVQVAALPSRNVPVPAFAPRQKPVEFPEPPVVAEPLAAPVPQADIPAAMPAAPRANAPLAPTPPALVPGADPFDPVPEDAPVANSGQPVVVANVPLPTRRPRFSPVVPALPDQDVAVLTALQSRQAEAIAPDASAPAADAALAAMAAANEEPAVTGLPIPSQRPDDINAGEQLSPSDFEPAIAADDAVPAQEDLVALASARPATPRDAILDNGGDTSAIRAGAVRTTAKSKRPSAADAAAQPKPRIVAMAPDVQDWALRAKTPVASKSARVKGKANQVIRTAPTAVIAQGFDQAPPPDPSRFSGSAVTFLSVARFKQPGE